jgi:anti-sigma factor RsiW
MKRVHARFRAYLDEAPAKQSPKIGYFCMEYGLHQSVRLYSGGLGVLAGAVALAIAAGLLLILGIGLLSQYALPGDDAIIAEAIAARQHTMLPQHVFTGDILSAPDRRNEILSTVLDMPLKVPDLDKMGYQLAEIRVYDGVPGGKAVGLDYRDAEKHEFMLYLRHPSSPARVDLYQREGLRICIWQDDVLGTVMLGEMSAAAMARIASLSYSGLNI